MLRPLRNMEKNMRIATVTALIFATFTLSGCPGHRLTGYNVKIQAGQTSYEDGNRSLYTGASTDFHFDVK